jgi:hypothetical protein
MILFLLFTSAPRPLLHMKGEHFPARNSPISGPLIFPVFVFADTCLLYALIENRVKAVSVCSRGSTSRK